MCPECYAGLALLVTGVISTGGVTAAAAKLFRNHKLADRISQVRKNLEASSKRKEKQQ